MILTSFFSPQTAEVPFTFTKNPTSTNTIELIDSNGRVIDLITYPHGQKKTPVLQSFMTLKVKKTGKLHTPLPQLLRMSIKNIRLAKPEKLLTLLQVIV